MDQRPVLIEVNAADGDDVGRQGKRQIVMMARCGIELDTPDDRPIKANNEYRPPKPATRWLFSFLDTTNIQLAETNASG